MHGRFSQRGYGLILFRPGHSLSATAAPKLPAPSCASGQNGGVHIRYIFSVLARFPAKVGPNTVANGPGLKNAA